MTTISARVNTQTKERAEEIAEAIGMNLSTVINVFLRRFVAEEGFPFAVTLPDKAATRPFTELSAEELTALMQRAVRETPSVPDLPPVTYLDPATGRLCTEGMKE